MRNALAVTCDLERLFGSPAGLLPTNLDPEDAFTFTRERLPAPPEILETDRLLIRRSISVYGGCHREDLIYMVFADRATARRLGVLVLAVLFHPDPATVEIRLISEHSDVKQLRIRYDHASSTRYFATPAVFRYWPSEVRRQQSSASTAEEHDLPELRLTTPDELGPPDREWDERDTVVGFGNERATVSFAELLLYVGLEVNTNEVYLESNAGFGGLASAPQRRSPSGSPWLGYLVGGVLRVAQERQPMPYVCAVLGAHPITPRRSWQRGCPLPPVACDTSRTGAGSKSAARTA